MKHRFFFSLCAWALFSILALLSGQAHGQGIQRDQSGNYFSTAKPSTPTVPTLESLTKGTSKTGATFTTAKGEKFPVWLSKNGSAFVVRTSKKGVLYRQYMPK